MSWGDGSMDWAELRDLVDALPEDSATKAAESGDVDGRRWTQGTYIQAANYNAMLMLIRVMWAAHLKGSPPEMELIDPPAQAQDEQAVELAAAREARNRAYLDRMRPQRDTTDTKAEGAAVQEWQNKIRELERA